MHSSTLKKLFTSLFALAMLLGADFAQADTRTLLSVADATLFQANPNNNLGDGGTIMAGGRPKDGSLNKTRGVLRFDLSSLPENVLITSATLTLKVLDTPSPAVNSIFDVRRLLVSWGNEGIGSDRSGGGPAAFNQVTWNNRFFGGFTWSSPGGVSGVDFSSALSASQNVAGNGTYNFSGANLLADVRGWYASPANNFGLMLMSESETVGRTVRRFGSREAGAFNAPSLNLQFTTVPEPGTLGLLGIGGALLGVVHWRRRKCRR